MARVTLTPFKLARMKAGLRQIDIARALGVSESLIAYWETGRKRPKPEHIAVLADMLKTDPRELFPEVSDNEASIEHGTTSSPR